MTDTMENEEAGHNVPVAMDEDQQLVDATVQPNDSSPSVLVDEASKSIENGKVETPAEDKNVESEILHPEEDQESLHSVPVEDKAQILVKPVPEPTSDVRSEVDGLPEGDRAVQNDDFASPDNLDSAEISVDVKLDGCDVPDGKTDNRGDFVPSSQDELATPEAVQSDKKPENLNGAQVKRTEEDQLAFMKELENFFRERSLEFKPPKFYGEGLNCLKLWRAVTRLGGYDKVTSCKLWRQVGESFKPPKTCTTVSWTFRGFYEKALLDYERHKLRGGELTVPIASLAEPMNIENQASGSGRARRDAAARAMQGWHSQRLLGNGEVSDPIIKDKNPMSMQKREKQLKSISNNLLKRKKPSYMDNTVKAARSKPSKPQFDTSVVDIGPPADWVKINVQKTKDCFEVYALVPGLLREEVRVQSDPAGRLVISGEPEHPDNPWGVTPFKKFFSYGIVVGTSFLPCTMPTLHISLI
ncbi:AT-rich interactive domain protein [Quillaja saponaria]|uniref:AT-rich interactive domain protein n=1 Tax=Quillaja saponaria TaxID=32244 RepID=A0AAD7L891_QUISA|nr:AT-rich interactive domain protein [Quillaja saponaria]